jgi:hypothetical protein
VGLHCEFVEPMGFGTTNCMETKEFCGASWPSKVLKRKIAILSAPLLPLKFQ